MQKAKSHIIIFTAIILFFPLSSALDFEFSHPDSVRIDDSFEVTINLDSQETYDVKIFVHKSSTEKAEKSEYLSEIYGDGWQDSWFYLKEAFPNEKSFKVRVLSDPGDRKICVRLRKSGKDSTYLKCDSILVRKSNSESKEESKKEHIVIINNVTNISYQEEPKVSALVEEIPEKIILKNKNSPTLKTIETKKSRSQNLIIYSTVFVFILTFILLFFRLL